MVDRKKKKKKIIKKKIFARLEASRPYDSTFDIDGVIKVVLSKITRRAIGCVLGEDLTAEEPWMLIKKEKILDNLELHEDSSEFLPIREAILDYPQDEMLIGFNRPLAGEDQEFYLCIKAHAKRRVSEIIEKQKVDLQERLKESINKTPGEWFSHGSEEEVDENINEDKRPLIEIELVFIYPLSKEPQKFTYRFVEQAVDGYVEILPRKPITNVVRKRVDASIQVTPTYRENEAQTTYTFPKNMWTQWEYVYDTPKLNTQQMKSLEKFLNDQADFMCETLFINDRIDVYTDDYAKISKHINRYDKIELREVISFRDVTLCKEKLVTDLELDPFISGIFAVAYGKFSKNSTINNLTKFDFVDDIVFGSHVVLIWGYCDSSKPKLILKSNREINCIKYCPYRKDILLGGCSSGQIVLWDLKDRLEKVENIEILTSDERHNRHILQKLMVWMKDPEGIKIVLPTVVSNINFSHGDRVSQIAWVLPNFQFTKNGHLLKLLDGEPDSMQFMSIGINGTLLIWDLLNQRIHQVSAKKPKKYSRLSEFPPALIRDVSEFKILNHQLTPIFKININDKDTNLPIPLSQFVIKNIQYSFKPIIPDPNDDIFLRTYYKRGPIDPSYAFDQKFAAVDYLGKFYHCYFEGHDFDQGLRVNKAKCKYDEFPVVHDGPIRICVPNRKDENLFLTVGGKIFAVWDINIPRQPIFWRKCKLKYLFGCWSSIASYVILLQRTDPYIESWDFLSQNKTPIRVTHITGCGILDMFSDQQRQHCKKKSFLVTDIVGGARIYKIPTTKTNKIEVDRFEQLHIFRKRQQERRECYAKWLEEWKKKHVYGPEINEEQLDIENEQLQVKEEHPKEKLKEEDKENMGKPIKPKTASEKWSEKQHKYMFDKILQRQKINLAEIQQNQIILQKVIRERKQKYKKQRIRLENKEKILEDSIKPFKGDLLQREKYSVKLPEDVVSTLKESYVEQYRNITQETLQQVSHNFRSSFCWSKLIAQGKEIRKSLISESISHSEMRQSLRQSLRASRQESRQFDQKDMFKGNVKRKKSSLRRRSSKKIKKKSKKSVISELETEKYIIGSLHASPPPAMRRRITPKSLDRIPL